MGTASFYQGVLPTQGLRVLAVFKNGLNNPPVHHFFGDNADLIESATTWDAAGRNVYHACASYATDTSRKGENAVAAKALWLDLDVGPGKPYQTAEDAVAALEQFRSVVALHAPWVVGSGGGIHAYFAFDQDLSVAQWQRLAAAFAQCLDHAGVKHDSSRTEDIASILRVPGTNNYKTDTPRKVEILQEGTTAPASEIFTKLKAYASANNVVLLDTKPAKNKTAATNDLVGTREYPPSVGEVVAKNCPTIAQVADTGGDSSYEVWWRAIGVAKHTTEPEQVAIHWTRNRANTGHAKHDHQAVLDEWVVGPTTCEEFAKHSPACATCKFNGKISSPIQLGTPELPSVDSLFEPKPSVKELPQWRFKEPWLVEQRLQVLRVGYSNGAMTLSQMQDDGTHLHIPICSRYFQVMQRVRSVDGTWQLEIAYEEYDRVRTFVMDSSAVTSPDMLRKVFSARELHIEPSAKAMQKTQDVIKFDQRLLHEYKLEVSTYPTLGWATEFGTSTSPLTGEFVIGNQKYAPKRSPVEVLLSDRVDPKFIADFRTSGTTKEWVDLIDHIYNRPGAEAYQFVIAASLAAPLVKLSSGDGTWHGIPVGLTGDSGAAKTTTAMVAMSIYGPPSLLRFNGNASKDGGQGDTPAALSIKMGSLNNLPFIIDEVTSVESERLSTIMFMLSAGKMKDRAESSGKKLVENNHRWDTVSFITGNDGLHERLRELRRQNTQDATMLRCFEVPIQRDDLKRVFGDVHRTTVDDDLLKKQYGCAGREWLQYLVDNRETIVQVLEDQRRKFKITEDDMSDIRFYKDLLINVQVAAVFATKLGLIKWDLKAMMQWARERLIALRDSVNHKDWEGTISDFIASLHGRIIVTSRMSLGRGRRAVEVPKEVLSTNMIPCARKAIDDRMFIVTQGAVRDWCRDNRVSMGSFLNEMHHRGYLHVQPGVPLEQGRMINIGSGTTISRPQAPCYELDYTRIESYQIGQPVEDDTDKVVDLADRRIAPPASTDVSAAQ